jgi:hypothetical protein
MAIFVPSKLRLKRPNGREEAGLVLVTMGWERWRTALTRLVILLLLGLAGQQLWVTWAGWQERPFDQFPIEVAKQDIPFPSVTVCPEGYTLWSGLRAFLNRFDFTAEYREMLTLNYKQFLQQKIDLAPYTETEISIGHCGQEATANGSR